MRDHFQIFKIRWRAQGHGSSTSCIYYHFKYNDTIGERGAHFINKKLGEIRTWGNVVKQGRCNILRITRLRSPTKMKDNEISNGRNCRTIERKPISSC